MALSRRYATWPPGEEGWVGLDLTGVLPVGSGIVSATLQFFTNTNPANATTDFGEAPVDHVGRRAWCPISGGVAGRDYQLRWTINDNRNHVWSRTVLMLCAESA